MWRRRDVEELQKWMHEHGHKMEVTFERGREAADRYVEMSPFSKGLDDMLCLYCQGYITTGFALVIQKAQ